MAEYDRRKDGKLGEDGEMVTFIADEQDKKVYWQIRPMLYNGFPKQIFLRELSIEKKDVMADVILVDKALQEQVAFTRQPSYTIIFNKPVGKDGDTDSTELVKCRLADNKIYFYQYDHGVNLYFRFNCNINAKDSTIGFNYKRTKYNPAPLAAAGN